MRRFYIAACLLLTPLAAWAQPLIGPYVSIGAGGSLLPNEKIEPAPAIGDYANHALTFDAGFAGAAAVGYGFGNGWRVELSGDYHSNKVKGIVGDDASELRAGGLEEISGGMVDVLYDFNLGLPITPYLGVGIGAQGIDHSHFSRGVIGFVFPTEAGEQTVSDFAYQATAGSSVPLRFMPGLAFTAEYRFMGLLDRSPSFVEDAYSFDGTVTRYSRHFSNDFNQSVLLGFRYAFLQAWQAAPPMPAPSVMPVSTPTNSPVPEPSRTYLVFFDWDRADLTPRARAIVAEAAQASISPSTGVQTTRIDVSGYTDMSGTPAYNQKLSVRRARSVGSELVRDGVPATDIAIAGYGESHPLVPTPPGVREPQNRRVEIVLH